MDFRSRTAVSYLFGRLGPVEHLGTTGDREHRAIQSDSVLRAEIVPA